MNRYLEKIAYTRLSQHVNQMGLPGSGKDGSPRMGAAALNKAYTGESPVGQVLSGGTVQKPVRGLFGLGDVKRIDNVPNMATRPSGDLLARQPPMFKRLEARKAGLPMQGPGPNFKPNIPGPKPGALASSGGFLSKVIGMAKRNPIAAGIAGAASIGGLAYAAGRRSNQQGSQPTSAYYQE